MMSKKCFSRLNKAMTAFILLNACDVVQNCECALLGLRLRTLGVASAQSFFCISQTVSLYLFPVTFLRVHTLCSVGIYTAVVHSTAADTAQRLHYRLHNHGLDRRLRFNIYSFHFFNTFLPLIIIIPFSIPLSLRPLTSYIAPPHSLRAVERLLILVVMSPILILML